MTEIPLWDAAVRGMLQALHMVRGTCKHTWGDVCCSGIIAAEVTVLGTARPCYPQAMVEVCGPADGCSVE